MRSTAENTAMSLILCVLSMTLITISFFILPLYTTKLFEGAYGYAPSNWEFFLTTVSNLNQIGWNSTSLFSFSLPILPIFMAILCTIVLILRLLTQTHYWTRVFMILYIIGNAPIIGTLLIAFVGIIEPRWGFWGQCGGYVLLGLSGWIANKSYDPGLSGYR